MNKNDALLTSASFLVTEDCNLRCKYCFENEKRSRSNMSWETAKKGMDFLCKNAKKSGSKSFNVMLFGGEPMLRPDLIEQIFKYGIELSQVSGVPFLCNMITNGTLLTPRMEELIRQYGDQIGFAVQLSVDGIKEVQNMYRVTADGHGSFDMVEKNIKRFQALFPDQQRLNIHGCINKQSLPFLFQNYKFFREDWGFKRTWFIPVQEEEWDDNDIVIYGQQLDLIADYELDVVRRTGVIDEAKLYAPLNRCFERDMYQEKTCGAGGGFVTISANGDIYPCHHIYFNDFEKETKLGDVWTGVDDSRRRIFLEYSGADLCGDTCDNYQCYRCLAVNWVANGSIIGQVQGMYCKLMSQDRRVQLRIRKEIEEMGLLNLNNNQGNVNMRQGNNPDNPACLCDLRSGIEQTIPTQQEQQGKSCECGNASSEEAFEILAQALKKVIDTQEYQGHLLEILTKKSLADK